MKLEIRTRRFDAVRRSCPATAVMAAPLRRSCTWDRIFLVRRTGVKAGFVNVTRRPLSVTTCPVYNEWQTMSPRRRPDARRPRQQTHAQRAVPAAADDRAGRGRVRLGRRGQPLPRRLVG